jgi:ABC-type branched-subunit amino acid transport system permease subunit
MADNTLKKIPHRSNTKTKLLLGAGLFLIFIWPFIAKHTIIFTPLATEILIFSLFGVAYNLSLGYTGLVSLGHAAFFGFGGYFSGALLKFFGIPVLLCLPLAVIASALLGALMGFITLRKTGVYFTLVTLALSQMLYYVAQMWTDITGGHEGMGGIPRLGIGMNIELTGNSQILYWFVASVVVIAIYVMWRVINSPFGRVMQAVRENEERAKTCGYDTTKVKYVSFLISAAFSGLAGCVYLISQEFFSIENINWTMSGTVLIMTLFGGTEVFLGPFVGALLFLLMKDSLSQYFQYWQIITGIIFIAIVIFLPEGILGSMTTSLHKWMIRLSSKKIKDSNGVGYE